jgi:hypothetical protein
MHAVLFTAPTSAPVQLAAAATAATASRWTSPSSACVVGAWQRGSARRPERYLSTGGHEAAASCQGIRDVCQQQFILCPVGHRGQMKRSNVWAFSGRLVGNWWAVSWAGSEPRQGNNNSMRSHTSTSATSCLALGSG